MRPFAKVGSSLWNSKKFRKLTEREKLVYLYLLTNQHASSVGCYALATGYMLADLNIDAETLETALAAIVGAGLAERDPNENLFYMPGWQVQNAPKSPNHCRQMVYAICSLPKCQLKNRVADDLLQSMAEKGWLENEKLGPDIDMLKGCIRPSEALSKVLGLNDAPYLTKPHLTKPYIYKKGFSGEEDGDDFNKINLNQGNVPRETSNTPTLDRRRLFQEFPRFDGADDFAAGLPMPYIAVVEKFYGDEKDWIHLSYAMAVEFWDKYVGMYPGDMIADGFPEKANWLWCWEHFVRCKHAKWKGLPPPVVIGLGQQAANRRKVGL